jgi:Ser/Thr protein kinase RdoA (MazF antagonist)
VLSYLVSHGLLERHAIEGGRLTIRDLSRSHSVVSVSGPGVRPLVVKRAWPRPGEQAGNLQQEMAVYRMAREHPALAAALPTCLAIDAARQILVLEQLEPGSTLRRGDPPSPAVARRLGALLGGIHRAVRAPAGLPRERPWILGILSPGNWRPDRTYDVLAHGPVRRELKARFDALTSRLELSCLVHGDLKLDNCLLDGGSHVRIVDWETAAIGDPAWDVAGILQDAAVARLDGGSAAPWSASFLAAYLETAAPADARELADRAARLAGARLVQTALECAAVDPAAARPVLDLALATLREPEGLLESTVVPA